MREIKFRIWSKEYKRFLNQTESDLFSLNDMKYDDPHVFTQFTGLHDKNGKEWYFGDICKDKDGSIGVLVWFDDCLGIGSGEINNYHAIDQVRKYELEKMENIGNIYEHPNLLEK